MSRDQAKIAIQKLVERFSEQRDGYHTGDYNETKTRRDFIDPFFTALGWDMDNQLDVAEPYREVIHEDKVKIQGKTKAPDYGFRLQGAKQRLFFVEAKKPTVSLKTNKEAAFQVRRYGWNSKVSVSILTNFEEFVIYDCTKKPTATESSAVARLKYFTYEQLLREFDFIYDTFSREAVLKGRFDKYIQSDTAKKGTQTPDKEFVVSLDKWRRYIAIDIAKSNLKLNEDEINFAVQLIIDRLIFLRFCEDRGVETYGQLKSAASKGDAYKNLCAVFLEADNKYNSGLFDFKKDQITQSLKVTNKIIKGIIEDLYYPQSEYDFKALPVEVLGNAYEQFLGKVIRINKSHHAVIEEKPEVRKAGGVYYTPQYIVDYIVENTVGNLIKGKTPKEVEKLKIVDPACGSGSFLLGAFQYLLNFHADYYHKNGYGNKKDKDNPLTPFGTLSTAEKKKILLNNIYGVDIDANAVEVTKLSLLLKCMEGETDASIKQQISMLHDRVLPDLDNNIRDGNSLIDIDFYDEQIDLGYEKKIKPFSWKKAFPEIVKQGGFDFVIGNPPYGASFSEEELSYFKKKFSTSIWRGESYLLFIEKAIHLLKPNGLLGYIIPDTVLNLGFTQSLRTFLLHNSQLNELVGLPSNVFSGATVDTILLFTNKKPKSKEYYKAQVNVKIFNKKSTIAVVANPNRSFKAETSDWVKSNSFNLQSDSSEQILLLKIESEKNKIEELSTIFYGIKAYQTGKGKPPQTSKIRDSKPFTSAKKETKDWLPFYDGKHIGRYKLLWNKDNWINYGSWLAEPRNPSLFVGEKILIRKIIGKTLIATYVPETSYCNTLLFILKLKDEKYSYKSILAILNSKLIGWYFRKKFQISEEDTFPQIMIRDILQFPIPVVSANKSNELDKLVDVVLKLNEELKSEKISSKAEQLKQRLEHCEEKIDSLVYELYNLNTAETKIIEENAA